MRAIQLAVACVALLVASAGQVQAGLITFVKSVNNPEWGQNGNQYQMDNIFGTGGWTDARIETVNTTSLFSSATDFIFLEIGNTGWNEGVSFIQSNQTAMENWVASGGRLLINGANNEGPIPANLGFGVTAINSSGSDASVASNPLHPIFLGPATPVGTSWDGSSFRHQALSGSLTSIIEDSAGNIVLGERSFGAGNVVFGTLTLPFFSNNGVGHPSWNPRPEVVNLHENIIRYAAATEVSAVPEPSSLALLGIGACVAGVGAACRRRREKQQEATA